MSLAISVELRSRVRKRDHSRCAYCLTPEELTVTIFEIDHIIPVSAGGETTLNNLCLCCPTCNRHKGYRTKAIDPQTGQAIPLYHPRQQKWAEHFAWSEDKLQIIGITPTGRATTTAFQMNRPQMVNLRRLWRKMGVNLSEG